MAATYADETFERLYARYGREVYRYTLALLRNPAEAEDATQTTFLNAYRALRAGERPRRPHNWLIAIAHNACRSRVRLAMRRPKEVPLDDVVEQLAVPEGDRPNVRELLRTIRRLPSSQCAAITMRELEGRSYVDIAERLGVTVPAAEALIGRARRTLREHAAAFRGLLLAPLPHWLRKVGENGEAAGGAVGTAAAAKIAALLVVGAIGGGIGVAAGGSSHAPSAHVEPAAAAPQLVSRAAAAVQRRSPAVPAGATPAPPAVAARSAELPTSVAPQASASSVAPGSSTAARAETAAAGTTVGTTVTGAVTQGTRAITTVVSELPTVTTPPVSTPAVTTPPITTPTVTTPTVTTPKVTTPTATTPVATVPPVTVPTVTVPTVTVPPLP
ncbi:MAG TPA: RNA polymerase sigma factor [Gaiellaceae bacterium]|jgi:RNA polymerase sigma factor (sigma-70 family)